MNIHLITCTGDRPLSFALCKRFVKRWSQTRNINWIIVDDGKLPYGAPTPANKSQVVTYIRRQSVNESPQQSFINNLWCALGELKGETNDAVFFIEDDDYYSPGYLGAMLNGLRSSQLCGLTTAKYFNASNLRWREITNGSHSSLCGTALRYGDGIRALQEAIRRCEAKGSISVDVELWQVAALLRLKTLRLQDSAAPLTVGLKGLPGRKGLGIGHRPPSSWEVDSPDCAKLRSWLGDDFKLYERFLFSPQLNLLG